MSKPYAVAPIGPTGHRTTARVATFDTLDAAVAGARRALDRDPAAAAAQVLDNTAVDGPRPVLDTITR